jgi:hypothetical protein
MNGWDSNWAAEGLSSGFGRPHALMKSRKWEVTFGNVDLGGMDLLAIIWSSKARPEAEEYATSAPAHSTVPVSVRRQWSKIAQMKGQRT